MDGTEMIKVNSDDKSDRLLHIATVNNNQIKNF